VKVTEFKQTSIACPSQWEGKTDDGKKVVIRYRWGYLSLTIGEEEGHSWKIGDEYDGYLEESKMLIISKLEVQDD
jgi:hypothetical protein